MHAIPKVSTRRMLPDSAQEPQRADPDVRPRMEQAQGEIEEASMRFGCDGQELADLSVCVHIRREGQVDGCRLGSGELLRS